MYCLVVTGTWMDFMTFHILGMENHTNWGVVVIFFRGVALKPPTVMDALGSSNEFLTMTLRKKRPWWGANHQIGLLFFFNFFYIPKVGCSISLTLKQQWKQEFLMELGMIIRCMRCGKPMGKPVWKVIYKCWVFLNYVKVYRRINCMFNWEKDAKSWEFGIVWGC